MYIKLCILILTALFAAACAGAKAEPETAQKPDMVIDDGYVKNEKNEIVIDDKDLKYFQEIINTSSQSKQEKPFIASDGSEITVMFDGYGNKSVKRAFDNHPRLQMVLMRISADGQKQVFVYAQNGEVKDLPPTMVEKVLTTPANDLANQAGVYEGKRTRTVAQTFSATTAISQTSSETASINQPTSYQTVASQQTPAENTALVESKPSQSKTPALSDDAKPTEETRQPPKMSENLQNYIPKKRNDAITDN